MSCVILAYTVDKTQINLAGFPGYLFVQPIIKNTKEEFIDLPKTVLCKAGKNDHLICSMVYSSVYTRVVIMNE